MFGGYVPPIQHGQGNPFLVDEGGYGENEAEIKEKYLLQRRKMIEQDDEEIIWILSQWKITNN